jgi:hypothetical protein
MKRQICRRLLVIGSVIMLIGLIASCGSEPEVKVLESMAYTEATRNNVENILIKNHFEKMTYVSDDTEGRQIISQYWPDINPLVNAELDKKTPSYGLMIVFKAGKYKIRIRTAWKTKPTYDWYWQVYK